MSRKAKARSGKRPKAAQEVRPYCIPWKRPALFLCAGFLAVWGVLIYHNSLAGPFVFDDLRTIVENPRIRNLGWEVLSPSAHAGMVRPVLELSLAVNYRFGELDPTGYRLFNIGVHILASLLLLGWVRRTLFSRRLGGRFDGCASVVAFSAALIWLSHPLQTQSVDYIIQRSESLMALCYLTVLYALVRSAVSGRPLIWQSISAAALFLGMGVKPVIATAPLSALLYDRVFLEPSFGAVFRKRGKYYAALVLLALAGGFWITRAQSTGLYNTSAGFELADHSAWEYLRTQPGVILHYLKLAFWPHPLCLDYQWPVAAGMKQILIPGLAVLSMLGGIVWLFAKGKSPWAFPGAFFFIVLLPSSGFIPIADIAFEHRMYLPLSALAVPVTLGVWFLAGRLGLAEKQKALALLVLAFLCSAMLGRMTFERNKDYLSRRAVWSSVVKLLPGNFRARTNLGRALQEEGRIDQAILEYETVLKQSPGYHEAMNNLANCYRLKKNYPEAIRIYREILRFYTPVAHVYSNLAGALQAAGKPAEALEHYREAIRLDPSIPEVHHGLGVVLIKQKRYREAEEAFGESIRRRRSFAQGYYGLGLAMEGLGRADEARSAYAQALKYDPALSGARQRLAKILS